MTLEGIVITAIMGFFYVVLPLSVVLVIVVLISTPRARKDDRSPTLQIGDTSNVRTK